MNATERGRAIRAFKAQHPNTIDFQEALKLMQISRTPFSLLRQKYKVKPVAKMWCCTLYACADIDRMYDAEQSAWEAKQAEAARKRALYAHVYYGGQPHGQFIAHCGVWHKLEALPFTCPRCHTRLFEEVAA